jgi:hypothetical protein
MSDVLGDLRLLLSAPSDRLLADLAAADRHVIDYHKKWEKQFSQITFKGLSGNLNVEMVAAEAVLSRSLANMQRQVKNSKLKLSIDTSGLDFSDMEARLAKLSQQTVRVGVDLEPLHSLNRLLYLKQKDIGDTQAIANKGINVKVDLSGLESMGRAVDSLQSKLVKLQETKLKSSQENVGNLQQKVTFNNDNLSRDVAKAVEQGFKSAQPSRLAQAAGKIADTATSPLRAIARGALEGFGKDMTSGLTGGLISSIEAAAGGSIGSTNLVGQKIGDRLAQGIAGKLGKSLKSEIQDQLRQTLGGIDIDRDFGAQVNQRSKSQSRKTSQAAEGLNSQRQDAVRESLALSEQKAAVTTQSRVLGNVAVPVERAIGVQESKLFDAQAGGDQKAVARAQKVLGRARSYLSTLQVQQSELDIKKIEIEQQIGVVSKRAADLDKRIEAVSPAVSDSYQKLVNAAAGKKVAAGRVPQIIAAPNVLKETGSVASYSARGNAILVSPELAAQYKSENVEANGIEASIHELTHGADVDFGSLAGVRADKLGKSLRERQYTAAEVAYAAPFVAQYAPKDRAAELSAYAAEYSIAHPLIKQNREARNLEQFHAQAGYGGIDYQKIFSNEFSTVKSGLGTLSNAGADPRILDHLANQAIGLKEQHGKIAKVVQLSTGAGRLSGGDTVKNKIASQLQEIEKLKASIKLAAGITNIEQQRSITTQDPWAEETARAVEAVIAPERKPINFRGKVRTARNRLSDIGRTAGDIVRPVVSFGRNAYEFAEGMESAVLPFVPAGGAIKSIGKNLALPALAYGATASIPGAGGLIHGTLGAGVESMLSLGGGAAQSGLTHAITGAFADLPMIGPAISSALSTAAGGAIEAGISAMAPVLAGQTLLHAGKVATKQIAGKSDGKTKSLGAASTTGALNAASKLVSTEISALPGSESTLPALPAGGLDRITTASKRIAAGWATIQKHISSGQTEKAKFIAEALERQTTNLIAEAKVIEAEVGKNTPEGNKLFSLQGNLGKKRKQAQNALKKIELIEEPELDPEIDDLRQKKATSRRKQFQKFKKSYSSKNNDEYFENLPFTLPSTPEPQLVYPEIPDPFEPVSTNKRPGAYLKIYGKRPKSTPVNQAIPEFNPPSISQPIYPSFETPQPSSAPASKGNTIINRLKAKLANFDVVAGAIEGTISNKELINKINNGESLDPATQKTQKLASGLKDLATAGKYAIGAFTGFQVGQILVTQFGAAIKESVALTGEFEQLQIRLQAATGSIQAGTSKFNSLRQEAKALGISQRGALETGARLSAATAGSDLEGAPTDLITSQILEIAKSRGLNAGSTNSLSLAISQIVGKRLSTEELNQLIESGGLPDAKAIGARALGLNPQQFTKQLESGSGIDGKKFLPAFLAQASSDSLLVKDAANDTQQSKLSKLQTNYENLQATIGAGINPAYKAGLDALSGGLDLLNKGVEIGSKVLIGFALTSIPAVVGGLYSIGKAAIGAVPNLAGMATGLVSIGAKLAIFYALGESIKFFAENLKDAGEETDKETVKIQTALDNLKGVRVEINLPKNAGEIAGKDWAETAILAIQRKTTPFLNGLFKGVGLGNVQGEDTKVVAERERREGRTRALEQIPQLQQQVGGAAVAAGQISKLDLLAQQLASRRSALFLNGADATSIRQLDQESRNLSLQRFNAQKSIAPIQGVVQQKLNQFKGEQDKLGSLAAAGQISESEFATEQERIKGAIEEITRLQEKLNKAIKSPLDDLAQYNRSLDVLAAKYEGISADVQSIENAQRRVRNADLVSGRASQGQSDYRQSIDDQTSLAERIVRTTASIAALKSQLNSIDPQQVNRTLANYGLNLQTTSVAEFNALSQSVTDPLDKTVLAKLGTIKQQSADLDNFKSQLDESRTGLFKKLRDENKGVVDYYRSISQSFDRDDLRSQSLLNNITTAKNRFQRVLATFGDSLADGFFGEISNLLESANDDLRAKAEQTKGLRQNSINLQNKLVEVDFKKSTLATPEAPTQTEGLGSFVKPIVISPGHFAGKSSESGATGGTRSGGQGARLSFTDDFGVSGEVAVAAEGAANYLITERLRAAAQANKLPLKVAYTASNSLSVGLNRNRQLARREGAESYEIHHDDANPGLIQSRTANQDIAKGLAGQFGYYANNPKFGFSRAEGGGGRFSGGFGATNAGVSILEVARLNQKDEWGQLVDGYHKALLSGDQQRITATKKAADSFADKNIIPKILKGFAGGKTAEASTQPANNGGVRPNNYIATGNTLNGINPRLLDAFLQYTAKIESGSDYFAKNEGGRFSREEAAKGFPASQIAPQLIRGKYKPPDIGKYQFRYDDYKWAQKLDPSIQDFLPPNQDKIAKLKIAYGGRGGAELLAFQKDPSLENADRVRQAGGNEWEAYRNGKGPRYRGTDRRTNYWNNNGNTTEGFYRFLLKSLPQQHSMVPGYGAGTGVQSVAGFGIFTKFKKAFDDLTSPAKTPEQIKAVNDARQQNTRNRENAPPSSGSNFLDSTPNTRAGGAAAYQGTQTKKGIGTFADTVEKLYQNPPGTIPRPSNVLTPGQLRRKAPSNAVDRFINTPIPSVTKKGSDRGRLIESGSASDTTGDYIPPVNTIEPPAESTQKQELYNASRSILDRVADLAREEKALNDEIVNGKYAVDKSGSRLRQTQSITNIDDQQYKTGRTLRERLRQSSRTAFGLINRPTQLDQESKQNQELSYSIEDSRQGYSDISRELDRAIYKGNAIITELSGKGKTATLEESHALRKTQELVKSLTGQRETLQKDINAAEASYSAARDALQLSQAIEVKDTNTTLQARTGGASLSFQQIYLSRQQELDKRNAPYQNDFAITGQRNIEVTQEHLSLSGKVSEIEKERRRYQGGDGSRVYNSAELEGLRSPFAENLKKLRNESQLSKQLETFVAERDRLLSIQKNEPTKFGETAKKALGQYQNAISQVGVDREQRRSLQRQIDNVNTIEKLNNLQNYEQNISSEKITGINEKTKNELIQRGIERRNYQSETSLTRQSSYLGLDQAVVDRRKNFGLENYNAEYDISVKSQQIDYTRQSRALQDQKDAILATGDAADKARADIQLLIDNLSKLNQLKLNGLAEAFNPVNDAIKSIQGEFRSQLGEKLLGGGGFNLNKIAIAGLSNIGGKLLDSATSSLFGGLYQSAPKEVYGPPAPGEKKGGTDWLGLGLSALGKIFGFAEGGQPEYDMTQAQLERSNTPFGLAMRKERAASGRTPVAIVANTDEMVLTPRQSTAYKNSILNFDRGGNVGGLSIPDLSPARSLNLDTQKIASSRDVNININITGDAAAGSDPVAMKQMVGVMRSIVTEELINHKRQRSGVI